MKSVSVFLLMVLVATLPSLGAVGQQYQTGTIVDVQQKERSRVLYYLVNTPVTQNDPYYEVSVQLKNTIYVGEYTPRHAADTVPEEWKPDSPVQVRVDKHHLFMKEPGGVEFALTIVKRKATQPAEEAPQPAPGRK